MGISSIFWRSFRNRAHNIAGFWSWSYIRSRFIDFKVNKNKSFREPNLYSLSFVPIWSTLFWKPSLTFLSFFRILFWIWSWTTSFSLLFTWSVSGRRSSSGKRVSRIRSCSLLRHKSDLNVHRSNKKVKNLVYMIFRNQNLRYWFWPNPLYEKINSS